MAEGHDRRTDALHRLAALHDLCEEDILTPHDCSYREEGEPPLISPYVSIWDRLDDLGLYLLVESVDPWDAVIGDRILARTGVGDRLRAVVNLDHWTALVEGPAGWSPRRLPVEFQEERSG
jgi:hypothetical protein